MKKLRNNLWFFLFNQTGASATQYGIIIAGVALALIFVFATLTGTLNEGFQFIIDTIQDAVGN